MGREASRRDTLRREDEDSKGMEEYIRGKCEWVVRERAEECQVRESGGEGGAAGKY